MTKPIAKAVAKAVTRQQPEQPPAPVIASPPPAGDPRIPKTAALLVTGGELQILYGALDELPGKFGRALYAKIQGQVQAQIDAALKAPPPK
jgi:hypothetical protein